MFPWERFAPDAEGSLEIEHLVQGVEHCLVVHVADVLQECEAVGLFLGVLEVCVECELLVLLQGLLEVGEHVDW